jgi:hypothetical protein
MSLGYIYDGEYEPNREDRMDYRIGQVPLQGADARLCACPLQERQARRVRTLPRMESRLAIRPRRPMCRLLCETPRPRTYLGESVGIIYL